MLKSNWLYQMMNTNRLQKILSCVFEVIILSCLALSAWNVFRFALNSESPIYLVNSAVDPLYTKGDILVVTNWNQILMPGDTVLYLESNKKQPTLHRVVIIQRLDNDYYLVTKDDRSALDARSVYPQRQLWLHRQDIMGKVQICLPYFGLPFIWIAEQYPMLKFAIIGVFGLLWTIAKDNQ